MKTSTVLLIGGVAAAAIVAVVVATISKSGGGGGSSSPSPSPSPLQGQLPGSIPIAVGATFPVVLPENPSTGSSWVLATSDKTVVDIADGGYVYASGSVGGPALHKYLLKGIAPGSATITAVLTGPGGSPVAGVSPLKAAVTVTALTVSNGGTGFKFRQ